MKNSFKVLLFFTKGLLKPSVMCKEKYLTLKAYLKLTYSIINFYSKVLT